MSKRGRPPKTDPVQVVQTILEFANEIVLPNNKIVSKTSDVWGRISDSLGGQKSAAGLYTFVSDNCYEVRKQFFSLLLDDSQDGDKVTVNLSQLRLNFIYAEQTYKLVGIVHRKPGHYTAMCPGSYGDFAEYDDLKDSKQKKNLNTAVVPELLIYARIISS